MDCRKCIIGKCYDKVVPSDGNLIDPLPQDKDGEIVCKEFMGGLLKGYRRVKKEPDIAA